MPSDSLPLVGVTQRVAEVASYGERRDCLDQAWFEWFSSVGVLGIPLPNVGPRVSEVVDRLGLDALVLSGGNNFTGDAYAKATAPVDGAFESRDATEFALVDLALDRGLPLVGFCRGLQALQVHFGGKLEPTRDSSVTHVARDHPITIEDPRLEALATHPIVVNSFHDFGVRADSIAPPLVVFATASDGFVEGLYHPDAPIYGAQWHPERKNTCSEFNSALLHHAIASGRSK